MPVVEPIQIAPPVDEEYEKRKQTVAFFANAFFEKSHLETIHSVLSSRKDRRHVITAAAKLLSSYGVEMYADEQDALSKMDESAQISALMAKLPHEADEKFQRFFKQLQQLVVCGNRVRLGLEQADISLVEEALEDAEDSGMSHILLRMATVQAGYEVREFRHRFNEWVTENATKTGKYLRGQEDTLGAQKQLAQARAKLGGLRNAAQEKAKTLMMNFAATSAKGLVTSVFKAWVTRTGDGKLEAQIAREYGKTIGEVNQQRQDYIDKQLNVSRRFMNWRGEDMDLDLKGDTFALWNEILFDRKHHGAAQASKKTLKDKMQAMKKAHVQGAKSMLGKMQAARDLEQLTQCFEAMKDTWQEKKVHFKRRDTVAAFRGQLTGFLKTKRASVQHMIRSMTSVVDTGLLHDTLVDWRDIIRAAKREAELAKQVTKSQTLTKTIVGRSKLANPPTAERMLVIVTFFSWQLDSRVERTRRVHTAKVEAKKQQLMGVQTMFRNFALQLEAGLKGSEKKVSKLQLQGDASLPDIGRPSSGSGRRPSLSKSSPKKGGLADDVIDNPLPREAWS
eukprot:TRINITY_DN16918_c0_g1_i3.p1 TRINITY_DN16918_c0_g1~~TRINITY_DN16918_c0_g1_i3.p1  ORF type:complete len:593 (-),score=115.57 TRINITY_DN16918_c0_g1_i3:105-1796(-)